MHRSLSSCAIKDGVLYIPDICGILHCLDAKSGKTLWAKKKVGYFHAALIRTGDGKLLVLNDSGQLMLFEFDARGARELAQAYVCSGTQDIGGGTYTVANLQVGSGVNVHVANPFAVA